MDLKSQIQFVDVLFTLICIMVLNVITEIKSDCGFPAIPVHSKIRPLTAIYYEDDIVEYYCEFKDMVLIDGRYRQCVKSEWRGDIPQCVHEIPRKYVQQIEMVDIRNHTFTKIYQLTTYNENYMRDYERYQAMTFYGNYADRQCIKSSNMGKYSKLRWKIYFKEQQYYVHYIEIVVHNNNLKSIDTSISGNVISDVYVNEYRVCKPKSVTKLDVNGNLIKYGFVCDLKNLDSNLKASEFYTIKYEDISNLTIYFAVNEITVCQLHVYQTFMSQWSACGSPDVPLHSNYTSVYSEDSDEQFAIGFKFACEEGFRLEGNPIVICGLNTKWLDTFPTCIPKTSCNLMSKDSVKALDLSVEYHNLYSIDGNITAINGSQAIFSCSDHDDNGNNKTLIGDSIRFCQIDGNWTGEEPLCVDFFSENNLDDTEYTIYLSEINENLLKTDSILPEFAHFQHRPNDCGIPAIPVYSKIFSFDEQIMKIFVSSQEDKIDLMPHYPNGTTITYHCESRFTYMANDFDARTCINGSWTGPIGKCYPPIGGTDTTKISSVYVYEDKGDVHNRMTIGSFYPAQSGTESDYWNFIETESENCAVVNVVKGQKQVWYISLTNSVRASYFAVRFETSRIFHHMEDELLRITRASSLTEKIPIRAELAVYYYNTERINCEITKVIEGSDWVTQISFRCDDSNINSDENEMRYRSSYEMRTSSIILYIDPDAFHENFNSTYISLCGLIIFQSPDDCGSPENVPNSEIVYYHNSGYVKYQCHNGYKLIGPSEVRCGKNGQWMDEFPRCKLYKLCDFEITNLSSVLQKAYYNTLVINDEEVAVLGTIVKYSCLSEDVFNGRHVLVGPRIAVCTSSGKWSANTPICRDEKPTATTSSTESTNTLLILSIVCLTFILLMITIVSGFLSYRFNWFNRLSKLVYNRRPIRTSSTFISYGQSVIRDSVISFDTQNVTTITNSQNLIRI